MGDLHLFLQDGQFPLVLLCYLGDAAILRFQGLLLLQVCDGDIKIFNFGLQDDPIIL